MSDLIPAALVERMRETAKDVRAKWELRTCIEIGRDVRRRVQGLLLTPEEHGDLENAIALALARAFLDGQQEAYEDAADIATQGGSDNDGEYDHPFAIGAQIARDIRRAATERCE